MTSGDFRALVAAGPVHFMGAGGAGMCALAEAVLRGGGTVTGCDLHPGPATERLESLGAQIVEGHGPDHLEGAEGLVVTAAIPPDHPEVKEARRRGLPVFKRAEALAGWVRSGRVVAVAGTHGKTTTSAMAARILIEGGLNPTAFVGGRVAEWEGNLHAGGDELFLVEADEFDRSFHALSPAVALVTNLEADHLDVYGSLGGVREAFGAFLDRVPDHGTVVGCADDPEVGRLVAGIRPAVRTYGLSAGAQFRGEAVQLGDTESKLRVVEGGRRQGELKIPLAGLHNVRNALGAAALARVLGVSWEEIRSGLAGFRGVARRFQRLGRARGIELVDDYAHHPTEVEAALSAARSAFPGRRMVVVFQPHLYTRTRDFMEGFAEVLAGADRLWLTEVYPAREEPIPGVDAEALARAVGAEGGTEVILHSELDDLPEALARSLEEGDLCLTLGAGSVERVGPRLLELLRGKGKDE